MKVRGKLKVDFSGDIKTRWDLLSSWNIPSIRPTLDHNGVPETYNYGSASATASVAASTSGGLSLHVPNTGYIILRLLPVVIPKFIREKA